MVSGITTFPKSIDQAVEDRLVADPGLKKQWREVTTRFTQVFAEPETAFKAVNVDAMLKNPARAQTTLAKIAAEPERFGALKGKTGLFAVANEKAARDMALVNAPALARNLERYVTARVEAERKHEAQERAIRLKVSIDIPALSNRNMIASCVPGRKLSSHLVVRRLPFILRIRLNSEAISGAVSDVFINNFILSRFSSRCRISSITQQIVFFVLAGWRIR